MQAHEKINSGAEGCGCEDCRWFVMNRGTILNDKFKDILNEMGVDYKKDIEITCDDFSANEKRYSGWYHAHGEIIAGPKCKFTKVDNVKVEQLSYVSIDPNFEILLVEKDDLAHKDFPRPILQIEFNTYVNK